MSSSTFENAVHTLFLLKKLLGCAGRHVLITQRTRLLVATVKHGTTLVAQDVGVTNFFTTQHDFDL